VNISRSISSSVFLKTFLHDILIFESATITTSINYMRFRVVYITAHGRCAAKTPLHSAISAVILHGFSYRSFLCRVLLHVKASAMRLLRLGCANSYTIQSPPVSPGRVLFSCRVIADRLYYKTEVTGIAIPPAQELYGNLPDTFTIGCT